MQTIDQQILEIDRRIEALKTERSALRRTRPPERVEDYELAGWDGPVRLSDLFEYAGHRTGLEARNTLGLEARATTDLLVLHNMGVRCDYCTLWADGFNGYLKHLEERAAFVVGTPDPVRVQQEIAARREWKFRMFSVAGSPFFRAMGYEGDNSVSPGVSAFRKDADGSIWRTGHSGEFGPMDEYCPPWPLFDLLDGGVKAWEPT